MTLTELLMCSQCLLEIIFQQLCRDLPKSSQTVSKIFLLHTDADKLCLPRNLEHYAQTYPDSFHKMEITQKMAL